MLGARLGKFAVVTTLAATAAGAIAAVAPASGSELPEFGYCVKVPTGTGAYRGSTCVTVETGTKGKYEFQPLSTSMTEAKPTFAVAGTVATLKTSGLPAITCASASISGEYTGPKTTTAKAVFGGCKIEAGGEGGGGVGQPCQNGATTEQIEMPLADGEIGFITNQLIGGKPVVTVGLDIRAHAPATQLLAFVCAAGKSKTETVVVEGSVIARITPIDKMTSSLGLLYKATKTGHQVPEAFEGGLPDTLNTTFNGLAGTFSGPSTLAITGVTGTNSAPLEIKAK